VRVVAGVICANMLIIGLYFGPQDSALLLSYLSQWGMVATLASTLLQFKAANYENEKMKASDKSKFPFSVYYKREAL